jgi:hypothetical protein
VLSQLKRCVRKEAVEPDGVERGKAEGATCTAPHRVNPCHRSRVRMKRPGTQGAREEFSWVCFTEALGQRPQVAPGG